MRKCECYCDCDEDSTRECCGTAFCDICWEDHDALEHKEER